VNGPPSWIDGPMCAVDTETTGVDVETARIVTACTASVGGGFPPDVQTLLVNPGIDIPAEATAIHGITTEHARQHGQKPAEAVESVVGDLHRAWTAGVPVVGYNVSYDLTVLDRESRRHLGQPLDVTGPVVDPLVIDRYLDRFRKGSRKLTAACEHYKVRLDGAHDASHDALAAARLVWRLPRVFPELALYDLDTLTEAQATWHAQWARSFADYLRAKGTTDDLPGEAWPIRPYAGEAVA
jgi:DNA polymerase-3 subunit epsilon